MIDKALTFIVDGLNAYLASHFPNNEQHAVLSSLANPDGTPPQGIENKLVLSLVNVERETVAFSSRPQNPASPGGATHAVPSASFSLYLLVSSSFSDNYRESLKFLSAALAYFFERPALGASGLLALPAGIESLSVEMVNLATQDLQNVWSITGSKYVPSVLYKVRIVTTVGWTVL